jgi:enoyl-CoA hydratase
MSGHDATVRATSREDGVLDILLDDGGPNALRPDVCDALATAVAERPDAPVLIRGREGMFCAGLDLRWIASHTPEDIGDLLRGLGHLLMTLWTHPRPVVMAVTGHAIAAGTLLAMAGDHIVAAEGGVWGLNETTNDMEIPHYGIDIASARLAPRDRDVLLIPGERIDAARAVTVGMADVLAAPGSVVSQAEERLAQLASLPPRAYAGNKLRLRAHTAERALAELDTDISALVAGMRTAAG